MALVFFRRRAGNVLAGIRGGQVQPSVQQIGIKLLGFLEEFHRFVKLPFLESGNALVQQVARVQFIATRNAGRKDQQRRHGNRLAGCAGKPQAGFP